MKIKKNKANFQRNFLCFPKPLRFCKKADIVYQTLTHLILITLIFAIFFLAATSKVSSKVVKQQVLEKQTALLIDAADAGMTIIIDKTYVSGGTIGNIELKEGRVFYNGSTRHLLDSIKSNFEIVYRKQESIETVHVDTFELVQVEIDRIRKQGFDIELVKQGRTTLEEFFVSDVLRTKEQSQT